MKHHIVVKTQGRLERDFYPFWGDVAAGKSNPVTTFSKDVDALFNSYNLGFAVTSEYKKKGGLWSEKELRNNLDQFYRIILTENKEFPEALIEQIRLIPEIKSVTRGAYVTAEIPKVSQAKSDFSTQLRMDKARKAIGLDDVASKSRGHAQVKVAVLDTGIDLDHPELVHCLLPGFDFVNIISGANQFVGDYLGYDPDADDEVGHGTHVAGIIGAKGLSMSPGVVPNCKIIPVRVLGAMKKGSGRVGAGLVGNINAGIKWAVDQGADVINMSLGIVHEGGGLPHEDVVQYAKDHGVTIVAATGNDGQNALYYPSALPYVIGVGAMNDSFVHVAPFSTYGDQVDFVAPGTEIYSTYLKGQYAFSTGTSHSAPFVAGAAALLKSYALQKGRQLKDRHVKYILKHTSDKISNRFKDYKTGYGMINLKDAIKFLEYRLNR